MNVSVILLRRSLSLISARFGFLGLVFPLSTSFSEESMNISGYFLQKRFLRAFIFSASFLYLFARSSKSLLKSPTKSLISSSSNNSFHVHHHLHPWAVALALAKYLYTVQAILKIKTRILCHMLQFRLDGLTKRKENLLIDHKIFC